MQHRQSLRYDEPHSGWRVMPSCSTCSPLYSMNMLGLSVGLLPPLVSLRLDRTPNLQSHSDVSPPFRMVILPTRWSQRQAASWIPWPVYSAYISSPLPIGTRNLVHLPYLADIRPHR